MLDGVPLLATTIALIGIFLYNFANLQLTDIRANWQERRCEPFVVAIANLVPTGKEAEKASEFAIDNFQYCLAKLIDSSIALFMAPMLSVFREQVKATGPIADSMNYLRSSAASLVKPLNDMMNGLWQRIQVFMYYILKIYQKIHSAFSRVFGIAISSIFAGISMYKGIRNLMNLVILVVIIILTILLVIAIFAIYLLAPVMPIILTTLAVISASVFGASVGGMADSFCVGPGTLVAVAGGWMPVEDLKPGDALREGVVEGVLKTVGKGGKCVDIDGLIVSESHLIFEGGWKPALEHSAARAVESPDTLYCLNTSTHTWTVKGSASEILLRDWEELPDGNDVVWEELVYSILNEKRGTKSSPLRSRPGRGAANRDAMVWEESRGPVYIHEVRIGDRIKDMSGYTDVLGVYSDIENDHGALWISANGIWNHIITEGCSPEGYHLITSSGNFRIFIGEEEYCVRDFTEVGSKRIEKTYELTLSLLTAINRNG